MGLRLVRRLAISLAIFGALFVAGNLVVENFAEDRIADAAADRFDLEQPPEVNIRGFPILLSLFRGELAGIDVSATDAKVQSLSVERFTATLNGISFEGGLLGGGALAIEVGGGLVEARVTDRAIQRFIRERGEDATVRITPERVRARGTFMFLGTRRAYDATGDVSLKGRTLTFEPDRVLVDGQEPQGPLQQAAQDEARFSTEIPELPGNFKADEVDPADGALVLRAVLDGVSIDLG